MINGKLMGKEWKHWQISCVCVLAAGGGGGPKSLQMVTAAMKLKDACSLEEKHDQPRQHIKNQRHYFANKVCLVKAMVFREVM